MQIPVIAVSKKGRKTTNPLKEARMKLLTGSFSMLFFELCCDHDSELSAQVPLGDLTVTPRNAVMGGGSVFYVIGFHFPVFPVEFIIDGEYREFVEL